MKATGKFFCAAVMLALLAANALAQTATEYSNQGMERLKNSDYTGAIDCWNKAVGLDPALKDMLGQYLFRAYHKRATASAINKDFKSALADLDAALAINPDSAEIRKARAMAEKLLKKSLEPPAGTPGAAQNTPKQAGAGEAGGGFTPGQVLLFAFILLGAGGLSAWGFKKFRAKPGKGLPVITPLRAVKGAAGAGREPEELPLPAARPVATRAAPRPVLQPVQAAAPAAGQVLENRYELKDQLGEGGMGVVYEAWDRQLKRKSAVKRMHSWLKEYPEEYGRFRREAEIVGQLRHPNIIGVHGIIEHAGNIYLVFDYIDGKPLSAVLKERKRFPLKDCRDILKGVCEAVHYAHKSNIIHRDLKPANIMLDANGYAMVMDFGLASELQESFTRVSHQTLSGTPAYMAPEQHKGLVKRESDIYALGVCLYEMLTGELPFEGLEALDRKKSKSYKAVSAHLPWLPAGIDNAIDRALEPEPSARFADALDFYEALNAGK